MTLAFFRDEDADAAEQELAVFDGSTCIFRSLAKLEAARRTVSYSTAS